MSNEEQTNSGGQPPIGPRVALIGFGIFLTVLVLFLLVGHRLVAKKLAQRQQDRMVASCEEAKRWTELVRLPLSSLESVSADDGLHLELDMTVTEDGNGAVLITLGDAEQRGSVRFADLTQLEPELTGPLVYEARVRTDEFRGMSALFLRWKDPAKPEIPETNSVPITWGWHWRQLVYVPEFGGDVEQVYLDLALQGSGRIWIDQVRVLSGPPWTTEGWFARAAPHQRECPEASRAAP